MSPPGPTDDPPREFLKELLRRRVLRTTAAYAVLMFVVVQLIIGLVGYYGWPRLLVPAALVVALIGGAIVVVAAWVFDYTPWGVLRTPDAGELRPRKTGLIDYRVEAVIVLLLLVAAGFAIRGVFDELRSELDAVPAQGAGPPAAEPAANPKR